MDKLYTVMVVGSNIIGNITSKEVQFYPRNYSELNYPLTKQTLVFTIKNLKMMWGGVVRRGIACMYIVCVMCV